MRDYLKRIRENKKMTQEYLASKLGINANYYCMIENGDRQKNMGLIMANNLAEALNVSVEFIISEELKILKRGA